MPHFLSLITRCRNEPFIVDFVKHYLYEGVDMIHIIADNINGYQFPEYIKNHKKVRIHKYVVDKNKSQRDLMNFLNKIYKKVRQNTTWMIHVDCDEYITNNRDDKTIKQQLKRSPFNRVTCIYVPWAMMACNNRQKDPENLLLENFYRWDHDKPHPTTWRKGCCQYRCSGSKAIFKAQCWQSVSHHNPVNPINRRANRSINSINCHRASNMHIGNLRNKHIETARLICYHYRIPSRESALRKIRMFGKIGSGGGYKDLRLIMSTDHAEIVDKSLCNKHAQRLKNKPEI